MTDAGRPEIGVVTKLRRDPDGIVAEAHEAGFSSCHLSVYDPGYLTDALRDRLFEDMSRFDVKIEALWAGWPGKVVWDFVEGPVTTGLVPVALRRERTESTKRVADFAQALGASMVMTHLGFVPEDLNDDRYMTLIPLLRDIAAYCRARELDFCFETGPTTPITLLRIIEDVGMENVGVNFDPANLLMYGKANPLDAIDALFPTIRCVHVKDGFYPTNTRDLGVEAPLGEGQVGFPALIRTLHARCYRGGYYVETEDYGRGRQQALIQARHRLDGWLRDVYDLSDQSALATKSCSD
jgi:sugar phosphate isomerase/epimerase